MQKKHADKAQQARDKALVGTPPLGEDQTPADPAAQGPMPQPLMAELLAQDEQKTSSSLLRNLSEGSLMGNNLLDALALELGVLYAIYAPKAVDSGKKGWKKLIHRFREAANGGSIPHPREECALGVRHEDAQWRGTTDGRTRGHGR